MFMLPAYDPTAIAMLGFGILKTAIFRQINKANPHTHHDALEFPNGQIVLLTFLGEGQQATVLQLPTTAGVKAFRGEEPAYSDQVSGSR